MRNVLFLCTVLLAGSAINQQTFTFETPLDAISIRLPHDDAVVMIDTDKGWHQFVIEKEFDPLLMESDLVMFPETRTSVTLRGQLKGITLHPILVSKEALRYELAGTTFYRAPRILRRNQWGANDEFLYRGPEIVRSDVPTTSQNSSSASSQSSSRLEDCNAARVNHPEDFRVARTASTDGAGSKLRWARRYSPDVKLLVVHHTALKVQGDSRPAIERMRALYEYHANSRGWGDIGYHYIVDEQGSIYEGRSGGDHVVGGHVYCGNVGTVGVALMGNFDVEKPTEQQVLALQWLLDHLAKKYDIDLNRNVSFKGSSLPPIVGHKDLIATDCPGFYMSGAMSQLRRNVSQGNLTASVSFPTPAKTRYQNRSKQRLAARLEEAGQTLSRTFYRIKRQTRAAARQNNSRLSYYRQQLDNSSNLQRVRSRSTRRPMRPTGTLENPASRTFYTPSSTTADGHIRIRLSYAANTAHIESTRGTSVRLGKDGNSCTTANAANSSDIVRIGSADEVLTIRSWNKTYNRFKGIIECHVIDGELVLINELSLKDYMEGISEQPDTEPLEKQKAFAVAARSYAAHYMEPANTKFPGKPYDGSDTGVNFQKYSGIGFAENNPRWKSAVNATQGLVLKKDGEIVKAAYYSSNDGRTRSPEENGWKNFPHAEVFSSKDDPWCKDFTLRGHGVGMSGCGAEGQANEGKTFIEILRYYYPTTLIEVLRD